LTTVPVPNSGKRERLDFPPAAHHLATALAQAAFQETAHPMMAVFLPAPMIIAPFIVAIAAFVMIPAAIRVITIAPAIVIPIITVGHGPRAETEQRNQAESGQQDIFHSAEFDVTCRTLFI
jgi:hypothetical protein